METGRITVDKILAQIKQLNYVDRIYLLKKTLLLIIKKENIHKEQVKLSSLNSLGAEVWKSVDIDKYVEGERQWDYL